MNLKILKSEFTVRKYLINSLIDKDVNVDVVRKCIGITFTKMYRGKHYILLIKSVNSSLNINHKFKRIFFWYFKFIILLIMFIVINKGDVKLKYHLYKIPFGKL